MPDSSTAISGECGCILTFYPVWVPGKNRPKHSLRRGTERARLSSQLADGVPDSYKVTQECNPTPFTYTSDFNSNWTSKYTSSIPTPERQQPSMILDFNPPPPEKDSVLMAFGGMSKKVVESEKYAPQK
ncbi:hypothetical protein CAPTEDRAFT_210684 [Capitella teleta]|uniref:Uncharacterized protein n=1 Tax=Capitella teleta TaxID=283909 RepID=R7UGC7_CAPTE|nr:hypothetical protein CAPTEDRAFT_210684 [Capitella teleta]|eukprot:ELU02853.1 hypothetical protein CAPTEDRAFT_210684 [Capitella teleta]